MKWFKHFTRTTGDAKIEKLIMKFGIVGYGLYFYCIEIIAGNVTDENITFELEHDAEILAHKLGLDRLKTEEIMKYMISLGLFESENGTVTCLKLAKHLDSSLIKNPQLLRIKKEIQENSRKFEKVRENSSQIRLDKIRIENKEDIPVGNSLPAVKCEKKPLQKTKKTDSPEYVLMRDQFKQNFNKFCEQKGLPKIYWDAVMNSRLKKLVNRIMADKTYEEAKKEASKTFSKYAELKMSDDKWFYDEPFNPSVMLSRYDKILAVIK